MSIPQFTDIISLSNKEVAEEIIKSENVLFNLRLKKQPAKHLNVMK